MAWLELVMASPVVSVEPPSFQWASHGGGDYEDWARGVAIDQAGNSYLTGYFATAARFGETNLVAAGSDDAFLAKYDRTGTLQWVTSTGASLGGAGYGVAVDPTGNVYFTGTFSTSADFGGPTRINSQALDIFLAKYDTTGHVIWATSAGGTNADSGNGIAMDKDGNCYLTGSFSGSAVFCDRVLTGAGSADLFVAKYDREGKLLWVNQAGGPQQDEGSDIAVDNAGNCCLLAQTLSHPTVRFGSTYLTNPVGPAILFAKYDAEGHFLGARKIGGSAGTGGRLALDQAGNAFITGNFFSGAAFEGIWLPGRGLLDIFLAKYDPEGRLLWVTNAGGRENDYPGGVAVDGLGNCFLTGSFLKDLRVGHTNLAKPNISLFVAKYDGAGTVLWAKTTRGVDEDFGTDIAVDPAGGCYVAGIFSGLAKFDGITITNHWYARPGTTLALMPNQAFRRQQITGSESGRCESGVLSIPDEVNPQEDLHSPGNPLVVRPSTTYRRDAFLAQLENDGLVPALSLLTRTAGGGSIQGNSYGAYLKDTILPLTAMPEPGWFFWEWMGAVTDNQQTISLKIDGPKVIQAVFGTAVLLTTDGQGTIHLDDRNKIIPFGALLRLNAVPAVGYRFSQWQGAVAHAQNPFEFLVAEANPVLRAQFIPLATNQVALTVEEEGEGKVTRQPEANVYGKGEVVTLTAHPGPSQHFLGWIGRVRSAENPLQICLTNSPVLTAQFTRQPSLSIAGPLPYSANPTVRLRLIGTEGRMVGIEVSADLVSWAPFSSRTLTQGPTQLLDCAPRDYRDRFYRAVDLEFP